MKKIVTVVALGIAVFIPGCKLGAEGGSNYLNFEVIDTQTSSSSISEMYIVSLSSGNYNVYNPITKTSITPGNTVTLSGGDSVNVSENNAAENNLTSNAFLPNGFYTYTNSNSIAWPSSGNYQNKNSYKVSLNYLDTSYSAIMNNIPSVYTINSASCGLKGGAISCAVATTGSVAANTVVVYTLNAGSTNQCTAKVDTSISTIDYVSFNSSCNLSASSTLTLQIAYNVPLTNITTGSTNSSFSMRGQYYFVSKAVSVTQ